MQPYLRELPGYSVIVEYTTSFNPSYIFWNVRECSQDLQAVCGEDLAPGLAHLIHGLTSLGISQCVSLQTRLSDTAKRACKQTLKTRLLSNPFEKS